VPRQERRHERQQGSEVGREVDVHVDEHLRVALQPHCADGAAAAGLLDPNGRNAWEGSRSSRHASSQVPSVLPLSAIASRKENGNDSVRYACSERTLASRTCASSCTGTTISTAGARALAGIATTDAVSTLAIAQMIGALPHNGLTRPWESSEKRLVNSGHVDAATRGTLRGSPDELA
jgi:hypothetical protein